MPPFSCGLEAVLAIVGGKWKPLILYHLAYDSRRYGDLKRAVGNISDKMLIQSLKEMATHGLVIRRDFKDIPPKVEYSLTLLGRRLTDSLAPLCVWGTEHMGEIENSIGSRESPKGDF